MNTFNGSCETIERRGVVWRTMINDHMDFNSFTTCILHTVCSTVPKFQRHDYCVT